MKHNIRINGEVKEIDCKLGSSILDKNGREIFEGDKVKIYFEIAPRYWYDEVYFQNGVFTLGKELLKEYLSSELEIVD